MTAHTSACSPRARRPQQRLITRDHIDFGRYGIPIVREEVAERDAERAAADGRQAA
ncbi:hypothetical protein [Streptomyces caniferus]|uniref:hypothetical protein n=1 Tax=Streptomyces caniferus TaxID=285557 RepID=UPI00382EA935